jgi:branched-chain amino acid transport system substrate-binding protein
MKQKLLALAAAVSLIAGVTVQAADTVKIGLMAPLTGSWASEGQGMKKIVELLAEQQNAKGGVLGKQIEVITEDDGGDPRTASLGGATLDHQGRRGGGRHLRLVGH